MIKLKFSDVGKFLASSAVIYSASVIDYSVLCHFQGFWNHNHPFLCGASSISSMIKYELLPQSFYTAGAYKLVDSVFEFKSVHVEAGVSTLAGAAAGALEVFMSNGLYIKNDDGFNYKGLVNIGTKAIASGALAYINHDYSSDAVELNDAVKPLNLDS